MSDFHLRQAELVAAIRNPSQTFKGKEADAARRLAIYQSLFFNNINNFLQTGFPVIHRILPEETWDRLARDYFASYTNISPYFTDISKGFVDYLQHAPDIGVAYPDFLAELAHYEWIELDVSIRQDDSRAVQTDTHATDEDTYSLSALASVVQYHYPVHQIAEDFQPDTPSATPHCFLVARNEQDEVSFATLQPLTALLLSVIEASDGGLTLPAIHEALAQYIPASSQQQIFSFLPQTLADFVRTGIVNKA